MSGLLNPNDYYKVYCNTLIADNIAIDNINVDNIIANTETVNTITVDTNLVLPNTQMNRPLWTDVSSHNVIAFNTPYVSCGSDVFAVTNINPNPTIPVVIILNNLFTSSEDPNYYLTPSKGGIYKVDMTLCMVNITEDIDSGANPGPTYEIHAISYDSDNNVLVDNILSEAKFPVTLNATSEQFPVSFTGSVLFSLLTGHKINFTLVPVDSPSLYILDSLLCKSVITYIAPNI